MKAKNIFGAQIYKLVAISAIIAIAGLSTLMAFAVAGDIERVSINDSGAQGDGYSDLPSISSDGRYVAFESEATNLVPGDTNGVKDVFVYDRTTDTIERVSVDNSGTQGNNRSYRPSISSDGRYVAFESDATNLVPGDTNGVRDIFVYDRTTDTIERVSVDNSGTQGDGLSSNTSISADGRYVAFNSNSSNLVSGDTNGYSDTFVYDRTTDTIERVSVSSSGAQGNFFEYTKTAISADGRFVAFASWSSNLVPGDTNGVTDIFVYDRTTDTIERVSVSDSGAEGDGHAYNVSISPDGRYVTFESDATNLVPGDTNGARDIFVYDRTTDTIERVSVDNSGTQGNSGSGDSSISADGRYVVFSSSATNLVSGDTNGVRDIFIYDRTTDTIERVSVDDSGVQGNNNSFRTSISADGRFVAFRSHATNLVPGDTNGAGDIFVKDLRASTSTTSSSSGKGKVRFACKDVNAVNYSRFGRHKASLCEYEESQREGEAITAPTEDNPYETQPCELSMQIKNPMRRGDKDGEYSSYSGGIVTEVSLLQKHINRILKDGYGLHFTIPVDGIFGSLTERGVMLLQAKLNKLLMGIIKEPLVIDGVVGPNTVRAVNNSC